MWRALPCRPSEGQLGEPRPAQDTGPCGADRRLLDQVYAGSLLSAAGREDKLESGHWAASPHRGLGRLTTQERTLKKKLWAVAGAGPSAGSGHGTPFSAAAASLRRSQPDFQAAARPGGSEDTSLGPGPEPSAAGTCVLGGWSPKARALGGEQALLQVSFCLERARRWQETTTPAAPGTRGHGLGVGPGQPCRCHGLAARPVRHRLEHQWPWPHCFGGADHWLRGQSVRRRCSGSSLAVPPSLLRPSPSQPAPSQSRMPAVASDAERQGAARRKLPEATPRCRWG